MATPVRFGTESVINITTADVQFTPDIATLTDGRFVVVRTDASQLRLGDIANDIRMLVFDPHGTPFGGEFAVNSKISDSQLAPQITALTNG